MQKVQAYPTRELVIVLLNFVSDTEQKLCMIDSFSHAPRFGIENLEQVQKKTSLKLWSLIQIFFHKNSFVNLVCYASILLSYSSMLDVWKWRVKKLKKNSWQIFFVNFAKSCRECLMQMFCAWPASIRKFHTAHGVK